jgi:hypothetical protein
MYWENKSGAVQGTAPLFAHLQEPESISFLWLGLKDKVIYRRRFHGITAEEHWMI